MAFFGWGLQTLDAHKLKKNVRLKNRHVVAARSMQLSQRYCRGAGNSLLYFRSRQTMLMRALSMFPRVFFRFYSYLGYRIG